MHRLELVEKILDYIQQIYKAKYVGDISVTQDGSTYTFKIGIPSYMVPTSIIYDADNDDQFLDFIYEELRTRNYMRLEIYKVIRTNDSKQE